MTLLDLFAGIGGFSLAAHWMGWQTVAFVEKEPFCQKVLRKNFGQDIEIHDDIFNFSGKPFRGTVDIITGGFPCQPFSAAGKRTGVNDERYLFPETLRVIREVQPAWIVLENVAGLLSMAQQTRDLKVASYGYTRSADIDRYEAIYTRTEDMLLNAICNSLEQEGYAVQPIIIPAVALGADHKRERLWIVARRRSLLESRNARNADKSTNRTIAGDDRQKSGVQEITRRVEYSAPLFSGTDRDASDTGCQYGTRNAVVPQYEEPDRPWDAVESERSIKCDEQRLVANSRETRLQGGERAGTFQRGQAIAYGATAKCDRNLGWQTQWLEAATRFCGMDDGLSDELDIVGARDNRVPRLKALGNSIVPQIAYEIFRAIDATDTEANV